MYFWLISLLVSLIVGVILGQATPVSFLLFTADVLATASSTMFGVLGIWVGLIGADILKVLYGESKTPDKVEHFKKMIGLFKPLFVAMSVFFAMTMFRIIGEYVPCLARRVQLDSEGLRITCQMAGLSMITMSVLSLAYVFYKAVQPGAVLVTTIWSDIRLHQRHDARGSKRTERDDNKEIDPNA